MSRSNPKRLSDRRRPSLALWPAVLVHAAIAVPVTSALLAGIGVASAQGIPGIMVMNQQQQPTPLPGQAPPQMGSPFPPQFQPAPGAPGAPMAPRMAPPTAPPVAPPAAQAAKPKPKVKAVAKAAQPHPKQAAAAAEPAGGHAATAIAVLVNGEPITNYEVDQRARLLGLQQQSDMGARVQESMKGFIKSEAVNKRWKELVDETVKQNEGKTREQIIAIIQEKQKAFTLGLQKQAVDSARASYVPGLRGKAREELIEELVKMQEAKSAGATPDEAAVDGIIKDVASRNNLTPQQFTEHFAQQGVDIQTFKARFRAQQAWADAIRRKYGHLVLTDNRDIDRLVQQGGSGSGGGEDLLELQLQRIVVPIPPTLDQRGMAQRLADAEQLQQKFGGCKTTSVLAGQINGARFEDMGVRKPNNFAEPTRTLLLNAKDEEMIPPNMTSSGIELIAVCGRKTVKASDELRNQKAAEIRQGEFERIAKKHLRDLMTDAVIENR